MVSSTSDIFLLAANNDVKGLQRLFSERIASPNDVDYSTGQTALLVSHFTSCTLAASTRSNALIVLEFERSGYICHC